MRKRLYLLVVVAAWLAVLAAGERWLVAYESAPGAATPVSGQWPEESSIRPTPGRHALLLFAHPQCPCTKATLGELAWVAARSKGLADVRIMFVLPPGAPKDWHHTDLWSAARTIPGAHVQADDGGVEARRFHAVTSGHVMLFDAAGRLVFQGGITAGRGHAGDNAGRRAVLDSLTHGTADPPSTPVFGCPLLGECTICASP
jgi:hypothetical protein